MKAEEAMKDVKQLKQLKYPLYGSYKLDGFRCCIVNGVARTSSQNYLKLVDKTDEDTHIFAIIVTVGENNLAAANVCIKGDINVIAQTLGQVIEKHAKLREAMMLDALASMMERQENKH